jgi:hypothetical protein
MDSGEENRLRQRIGRADRRSARFVVPGATVSLVREEEMASRAAGDVAETLPVADISCHGISFVTNSLMESGRVSFLLKYSDLEDPIRLQGRVVHAVSRGALLGYRYRVGAEFDPFSNKKGHNSLQAMNVLNKLERTYGRAGARDVLPGS